MRKTALIAVLLLVVAACARVEPLGLGTTTPDGVFPVGVEADNGTVPIDARPERVISLSAVATEMLFAIGAGSQVIAVDDQSNYPDEAPMTELSGFTPNLEAILSYEPDLVVITFDPGDLVAGLETAGVPTLTYTAAFTIDDVYRQIGALGLATGNVGTAAEVSEAIEADLETILDASGDSGEGVSYYHEIDSTYYTVTSSTFFGEIYGLFGMVNVADAADPDGEFFGYPQLSSEYIVASDPNILFLADSLYGESHETVAARPGWDVMTAVLGGDVVELDSDVASRWGPRIVDLARAIAEALEEYDGG